MSQPVMETPKTLHRLCVTKDGEIQDDPALITPHTAEDIHRYHYGSEYISCAREEWLCETRERPSERVWLRGSGLSETDRLGERERNIIEPLIHEKREGKERLGETR